jgi:DNA-binding NtrC family response regulator
MDRERIVLVDGDPTARSSLVASLRAEGFEVVEAASVDAAIDALSGSFAEGVVADATLPDCPALIARARAAGSDAAFLMTTRANVMEPVVAALRAGADNYIVKPLDPAQVTLALEKVLEKRRLRRERGDLRERVRERYNLVGFSPELQLANEVIRTAGPTKATVLVVGEPGTGKKLVAQGLHEASPRRDRPFVCVSCAALSEVLLESEMFGHESGAFAEATGRLVGKFEQADGGTLFLQEIANLAPAAQVKLLRVLQHGEFERVGGTDAIQVDVRVVASTNRDLAQEVAAGRFRDDLYYRLDVVTVRLTPLCERKGDIPALVEHFIDLYARDDGKEVRGVTPGALSTLFAYDWPGNVRELENVIEHAVRSCQGTEIGAEDLSPVLHGASPDEKAASTLIPGATLFEIEREAILRTLDVVGGSTARAAEVLGISVRKIQYRLKEYKTGRLARRRRSDPEAYFGEPRS